MTQPPTRAGREKPRRARIKTDFWCDVAGARNTAHVHVRNLTLDGCRLLSPCAFPKGEVVDLAMSTSENEPDLKVQAEIRWLGLNPDEGPFVLGCRFVHTETTADRVEKLLRSVLRKMPLTAVKAERGSPRKPGSLDLQFASEELDRLLRPGLSAPLPGSPGAPRGGSARS